MCTTYSNLLYPIWNVLILSLLEYHYIVTYCKFQEVQKHFMDLISCFFYQSVIYEHKLNHEAQIERNKSLSRMLEKYDLYYRFEI